MDFSVVIPCYREEEHLEFSVSHLMDVMQANGILPDNFEILLVVEKSPTRTLEVAKRLEDTAPQVRVLANDRCYGKGFTVRRGVMETSGEHVLVMDADMPVDLWKYLHIMKELMMCFPAAAVYATALGDKTDPRKRGRLRADVSFLLYIFRRVLLRQYITDSQLGCKLYRGDILRSAIPRVTESGFLYDIQLTDLLLKSGLTIEECAVHIQQFSDESSVTWREIFRSGCGFLKYVLFGRRRLLAEVSEGGVTVSNAH